MSEKEVFQSHILGLPVYSLQDGYQLGRTKLLLVNPAAGQILGILVEGRRGMREARVLPLSAVYACGEDGVIVEHRRCLESKNHRPDYVRALRQPHALLNARVFTAGGDCLGQVIDYSFTLGEGNLSGIDISGSNNFPGPIHVPIDLILAIATRTIMIKSLPDPEPPNTCQALIPIES